MSKITDWLNTNRSVSFTDEGASVVSSNFPSISDIKLTPNEKFNLPDGTTKYDLLLADGSEVDESKHPEYYAKIALESGGNGKDYRFLGLLDDLLSYAPNNICCSDDMQYIFISDSQTNHFYRSDDYGVSFTPLGKMYTYGAYGVTCSSDGSIVYFTQTPTAYVYKSVDFGATFSFVKGLGISSVTAITCNGLGDIVYLTDIDSRQLYLSVDSALTFTSLGTIPLGAPRGLCCDSAGDILYVVSDNFSLYKSTDRGNTLILAYSDLGANPYFVACSSDASVVYVNGYANQELNLSLDGATTFTSLVGVVGGRGVACDGDGAGSYILSSSTYGSWVSVRTIIANRPLIDSGSDECPYRIVADKHTPSIGDVRRSNLEKYSEDGVAMFDYLLADGSVVEESTHPILWSTLAATPSGGLEYLDAEYVINSPLPTDNYYSGMGWDGTNFWFFDDDYYLGETYNGFKLDTDFQWTSEFFSLSDSTIGCEDVTFKGDQLYIISSNEYTIFKISSTGAVLTQGPYLWDYDIDGGTSITYDEDRDCLWLLNTGNNKLLAQVDIDTLTPTGLTIDVGTYYMGKSAYMNNSIFAVDVRYSTGNIFEYNLLTDELTSHQLTYPADNELECFCLVSNGADLFIQDGKTNTVYKVGFSGGDKTLPTNTSPYPNFPDRVVADLTEGDL